MSKEKTSLEIIDEEHDNLLNIKDDIIKNCQMRNYTMTGVNILMFKDSLLKHFIIEERIMTETHYPNIDEHIEAHIDLLEKAKELCDINLYNNLDYEKMLDILEKLVENHADSCDADYKKWITPNTHQQ